MILFASNFSSIFASNYSVQALKNWGNSLNIAKIVTVTILNLVEFLNGYFEFLFQVHGLLKYTVFCYSGSFGTGKVPAIDWHQIFPVFLSNILAAMSKAFKISIKMSGIPFSRWSVFKNAKEEGIHCFFVTTFFKKLRNC